MNGFTWLNKIKTNFCLSSSDFCSDTYAGPTAESELETKAVVESINKKLGQWDAFYSIHSKGKYSVIIKNLRQIIQIINN